MASCITAQWVNTAPQAKLTVTQSSSTPTAVTLAWTLQYIASHPASTSSARTYTVTINGSTAKSGSYNINGVTGTKTVASGTVVVSKGTSAKNVSFSVSFAFNLTWSGVYGGTKSASSSISVAKKTSYTITYNANGGSGAPSSQTKWHGTNLTLSNTKPTRTGYTFSGWATSSSGSKVYSAGSSYTSNASVTLYAVWTAITYTVKYNANGGSGAPGNQTKTYGKTLTLSSTKPTRTNYTFKGWATSANATTVSYAAGASYTKNAAITLYAIWQLAYTKPRISSFSVARCNSGGTTSEEGTYALVKFSWATDNTVSSVKIEWKLASSSSWSNSATVTSSGTSASVSQIIGANALSTDSTYSIRITVADASGSTSRTASLGGIIFPIDVHNTGRGVAFGKPAELTGYADFGFKTRHRDNTIFDNNRGIYGKSTGDATLHLMNLNTNDNLVIGYGGYENGLGATNIYGNAINMYSNNGVYVSSCRLATNKILWSGGYYMNETQSCTLSEAVSKQANGIVLVWSLYSDGENKNSDFNMTFVPKQFVSSHAGCGVTTMCSTASSGTVASKYTYIKDTEITGYSTNNDGESAKGSGLTTNPSRFVLRYVIGV